MKSPKQMISLPIYGNKGKSLANWPVRQGIPIPEGSLRPGTPVLVRGPNGAPLPTQAQALATWRQDRQSVKWLQVDFPVSITADEPAVYQLDLNPSCGIPEPPNPVVVRDSGAEVSLSNGLTGIGLQRDNPMFWQQLFSNNPGNGNQHVWLQENRYPWLEIGLQDRNRPDAPLIICRSDAGSFSPLIEVENAGAVRSTVLICGYHFTPDGFRVCPYRLRIHLFANRPEFCFEHTLIFDQTPEQFSIVSYGLHFPLIENRSGNRFIGTEQQPLTVSPETVRFGFVQTHAYIFSVFQDQKSGNRGGVPAGWIQDGDAAACIRGCHHDYPVGLQIRRESADADQRHLTLDYDFWPASAGGLDLHSPFGRKSLWIRDPLPLADDALRKLLEDNPDAPLDLHFAKLGSGPDAVERCRQFREQMERLAPDRPYAFSNTDIGIACGTAKTHTAWLRLSDSAATAYDEIEQLAACAQLEILALPQPGDVCDSGAARLIHPFESGRFTEIENALESLFKNLVKEPASVCGIDGKFNHGELINGHNVNDPVAYRTVLQNPGSWPDVLSHLGMFNNESQDVIRQLWSFYLHTGNPEYFEGAAAKSRHTLDIDFIHRLPRDAQICCHPNHPSRWEGQMHYHSATHWSGPVVTSHSLVSGLVTHYYLTGENRAREVILAMADNLVRNQTPNGLLFEKGLHREISGGICTLLEAWQLTWKETYRTLALNTLRMLYSLRNATGNIPQKIYTGLGVDGTAIEVENEENRTGYPGGMLWYVLHDAALLWPDEAWIRDWILQLARSWVHGVPADDVLPAERISPCEDGGLTLYEIAPGWLWHSWISFPNFFFDPLVVLAWEWTRERSFLGYLIHRARVFPTMAADAARCFTGHSFNAINHAAEAVVSIFGPLAEAGEDAGHDAWLEWKKEREEDGFPVSDGPYSGYDSEGRPHGNPVRASLRLGSAQEKINASESKTGRIYKGNWDPVLGSTRL